LSAAPRRWSKIDAQFDGVIFDMDGVLVDGEPLHFRAINQLLEPDGVSLTLEQYLPYLGTKAGWREFVADLGLAREPGSYETDYNGLILAAYERESTPLPGAVELVQSLRDAGMPLAIASSSARPWVDACLRGIGLDGAFTAVVTGSDIVHGKPDPEIYLRAAEALGLDPARCLAFEDAPAGIASARAAGMTCWAVLTPYTRRLALPSPDRVFESLVDVDPADILGVCVS
jgi:HAD superfamily hydrolase (TIGR01509 family)